MPEIWYRKLGFYNNPFSIKPGVFHTEVLGHDIKEVYERIRDGKVVLLEGEYGVGKTTLLKQIISRFGGHKKLIYYNASIAEKRLDADDLLRGSLSAVDRLTGREVKGVTLLIDEAQFLQQDDYEQLIDHYNNGSIKSLLLVGFDFKPLPRELNKLLAGNRIKLFTLNPNQAVQMIRKRIGPLNCISDSMIKRVYHASKNPRALLENCEDLLRYVVEENGEVVRLEHLKRFLREKKLESPKRKTRKVQPVEEPQVYKQNEPAVEPPRKPKQKTQQAKARKPKEQSPPEEPKQSEPVSKPVRKPHRKPAKEEEFTEEPPAVVEDTGKNMLRNVYEEE